MDYKKAYNVLFNAMTDAISELYQSNLSTTQLDNGIKILKDAQCKTEDMHLDED